MVVGSLVDDVDSAPTDIDASEVWFSLIRVSEFVILPCRARFYRLEMPLLHCTKLRIKTTTGCGRRRAEASNSCTQFGGIAVCGIVKALS